MARYAATTEPLVPAPVVTAAKRAFIRTAAQSLSAAIPTTAIAVQLSGEWALGVGLGIAGGVATAVLAGTASALSILSQGIPEDYAHATGEYVVTSVDQSNE